MARIKLRIIVLLLLGFSIRTLGVTTGEQPWRLQPEVLEQLLTSELDEIESDFTAAVPEEHRLPCAIILADSLVFKVRRYDKAEKILSLVLQEVMDLEPPEMAADVHLLLMIVADRNHDLRTIIRYGKAIAPAFEKENRIPVKHKISILSMITNSLSRMSDMTGAAKWGKRLMDVAEESGEPAVMAQACFEYAETCYVTADFKEAEQAARRAKVIYRNLANETGLGNAEKVLGNIEKGRNNSKGAQQHYAAAIVHYEKSGEPHGLGNCHFNLGLLLKSEGDTAGALKAQRESIYQFTNAGSPEGAAMARTRLGEILSDSGEFLQAKVHLEEAKSVLTRCNVPNRLAELHFIIGALQERLGDPDAAVEAYFESRAIYVEAGNSERVARIQQSIDRVLKTNP